MRDENQTNRAARDPLNPRKGKCDDAGPLGRERKPFQVKPRSQARGACAVPRHVVDGVKIAMVFGHYTRLHLGTLPCGSWEDAGLLPGVKMQRPPLPQPHPPAKGAQLVTATETA